MFALQFSEKRPRSEHVLIYQIKKKLINSEGKKIIRDYSS